MTAKMPAPTHLQRVVVIFNLLLTLFPSHLLLQLVLDLARLAGDLSVVFEGGRVDAGGLVADAEYVVALGLVGQCAKG